MHLSGKNHSLKESISQRPPSADQEIPGWLEFQRSHLWHQETGPNWCFWTPCNVQGNPQKQKTMSLKMSVVTRLQNLVPGCRVFFGELSRCIDFSVPWPCLSTGIPWLLRLPEAQRPPIPCSASWFLSLKIFYRKALISGFHLSLGFALCYSSLICYPTDAFNMV